MAPISPSTSRHNGAAPLRVGIIGAGISGVVTAAHLIKTGIDVTLFERLPEPGGIWLFDKCRPIDPHFPSALASKGEEYPPNSCPHLEHSPPGACYLGLTNNISTRLLQTTVSAFPCRTPDFVRHPVILEYIQNMAKTTGVDNLTLYRTRVTDVRRVGKVWRLTSSIARSASDSEIFSTVQDVRNVLLLGAGTSSIDIAREIGSVAGRIYQSSRGGRHDFTAKLLPENGIRVGAVTSFDGDFSCHEKIHELPDDTSIPFTASLQSGQKLCNIHYVIICTGYHFSFPFLRYLHEDHTPVEEASDKVLVTDGQRVHNLYKHIFYIPDPTLVFIGLPYHVSTWNLYDFQAIAVTAVFSGRAVLPSGVEMWEDYQEWVKIKQGDKNFHSLGGNEESYVQSLLAWINKDAASKGLPVIPGHTPEFHIAKAEHVKRLTPLFDQHDGGADPAFFAENLPICT